MSSAWVSAHYCYTPKSQLDFLALCLGTLHCLSDLVLFAPHCRGTWLSFSSRDWSSVSSRHFTLVYTRAWFPYQTSLLGLPLHTLRFDIPFDYFLWIFYSPSSSYIHRGIQQESDRLSPTFIQFGLSAWKRALSTVNNWSIFHEQPSIFAFIAARLVHTCIPPLNGRRGAISGDTINTVDIASSLGFFRLTVSHESQGHLPRYSHDLLLPQHPITMITTRGPPLPPPVSLESPRLGASVSNTAHSRRSMQSPRGSQRVKKQSKWSAEEDAIIIGLRGAGMKWEDVSKRLPGRSAISCRLHYQNYLERRSEWDEERKNKLARLYER